MYRDIVCCALQRSAAIAAREEEEEEAAVRGKGAREGAEAEARFERSASSPPPPFEDGEVGPLILTRFRHPRHSLCISRMA